MNDTHGAAQDRDRQDLSDRLLSIICDVSAESRGRWPSTSPPTLDSHLERDFGLDSLSRLELLGRVEEHFQVTLSEKAFVDAETPRDLLRAVEAAPRLGAGVARKSLPPSLGTARNQTHGALRDETQDAARGQALETPDTAQTLIDVLEFHAAHHAKRRHILLHQGEEPGDWITYGELKEKASAIAAGLLERRVDPGDPVAIMLPPSREYFFSFFAALLAGGVPVPLYPPARPTRIEEHLRRQTGILDNCGARALITTADALRMAKLLKLATERLQHVLTPEDLERGAAGYTPPRVGPRDTGLIQYTSGSTGDPKGVVLSHANLLANMRAIAGAVGITSADVGVSWLPLYHDMGLIGVWLGGLYCSCPLVIMSPLEFLARPERWLKAIDAHRGTISVAPNFAYELCVQRIKEDDVKGLDLSSWRVAFNGAEPVNPDTIERFCDRFAAYGFRRETMMPVYGLAESTVALSFPPYGRGPVVDRIERERFVHHGSAVTARPDDAGALRFVSCGRPLPGHEIRIVDPGGHELPDGTEGHLQFRGPSATSGYYRKPDATRALFDGSWLDSGDLAYISNGEVYITGRSKDVIIRAGRNIYPEEIEAAVGNISGVRKGNVAAFGTTDAQSGTERLVIVAETRVTDPAKLERMRSDINGAVADIAGSPPDDIVAARPGTIPKTTSGKIRRSAARESYEHGKLGEARHAVWRQVAHLALSSVAPRVKRLLRRGGEVARTIYAFLVAVFFGAVSAVPVACLPRLSARWAVARWASRMIWRWTCTPLLFKGGENIPRDRPCILVSNHASYVDSFVLAALLPIPASFVAKAELTRNPITRFYLGRLDTEFIDRWNRGQRDQDTRRIFERAREGRTLLFYAEGGMSRRPGLGPFKMGAFVAAAESGLPVVPVVIRGTRSILRPDTYTFRRGAVVVTVGPAIDTQSHRAETRGDSRTLARRLHELTRDYILQHCGEPDLTG